MCYHLILLKMPNISHQKKKKDFKSKLYVISICEPFKVYRSPIILCQPINKMVLNSKFYKYTKLLCVTGK